MTGPELGLFSWGLGKAVCYMSPLRKKMGVGVLRDCVCVCVSVHLSESEVLEHWLWSTVLQQLPPLPSAPQPASCFPPSACPVVSESQRTQSVREQGSQGLSPTSVSWMPSSCTLLLPCLGAGLLSPQGPLRKCSQDVPAPTPLPFTYL